MTAIEREEGTTMTTHTVTIEFDAGEPAPYYRLVCSDNGGPDCAHAAEAQDCADLAEFKTRYLIEAQAEGLTPDDALDAFHADVEALHGGDWDCEGWWWEGDHYHHGPAGSGCGHVAYFSEDPSYSWDLVKPMSAEVAVEVHWRGEDEPLGITPVAASRD